MYHRVIQIILLPWMLIIILLTAPIQLLGVGKREAENREAAPAGAALKERPPIHPLRRRIVYPALVSTNPQSLRQAWARASMKDG